MPATDIDREWVIHRVGELADSFDRKMNDEVRAQSRSILDTQRRGEQSPEVTAEAFALAREALHRTTGALPDVATVATALQAIGGTAQPLPSRRDTLSALIMALYWHSLAGRGVHFVAWDEAGAHAAREFFDPVGALLGCDAALITASMSGSDKRRAYESMVTFGPWEEMSDDYLRDNLRDSHAEVVQQGLYVAVVDDTDAILATRADTFRRISGPRVDFDPPGVSVTGIASSFRNRRDYRIDHRQGGIWLTKAAMQRLKSAVGWTAVPSQAAVTVAERVEAAIARREGVGTVDREQTFAEVSLPGYLQAYRSLTFLSPRARPGETFDELLTEFMATSWQRGELAFDQLVDRHCGELFAVRRRVLDEPDALALVEPLVADAVRAWHSGGLESLISGLRAVLGDRRSEQEISDAALSEQPDALTRSILLVMETIQRRTESLGRSLMTQFVRAVMRSVIDYEQRMHLSRMQFLRRNSKTLYDPSDMVVARAADATALFDACRQAIRADSIRYIFLASPAESS